MEIELCNEFYYRINDAKMDVCREFNSSKENVLRNNETLKHYAGEWVRIKVNDFIVHHVKPMETINEIAKIYGIDELNLKVYNNLASDRLFIGQKLKIYNKNSEQ